MSEKTTNGAASLTNKLTSQDVIYLVRLTAEKVNGIKRIDVSGLSIET